MHTDPQHEAAPALDAVPVFPLPNTVLFPGVVLPLHIFEPRYQALLADVMAGSEQMVLTWMPPATQHEIAQVGCLARVVRVERQADGRANVLMRGEERVRLLQETTGPKPYLRFAARRLPRPGDCVPRARPVHLATLHDYLRRLGQAAAAADRPLFEVMRASSDPLTMADFLAASLVRDPRAQQAVLECDDLAAKVDALGGGLAEALLRLEGPRLAGGVAN